MAFEESLKWGQIGESKVAEYMKGRGWQVLPIYETDGADYKGPRVFGKVRNWTAPDILVFQTNNAYWVECKRKSRFSWHGKTRQWVTGIDHRHYQDYKILDSTSPWPVYLMFYHEQADTWKPDIEKWGAPPVCPTGLFTVRVTTPFHHSHTNWGRSGMVYWSFDQLKKLSNLF